MKAKCLDCDRKATWHEGRCVEWWVALIKKDWKLTDKEAKDMLIEERAKKRGKKRRKNYR